METLVVEEVEIDRCGECGGLWLDALEREKLLESPEAAATADAHERGKPVGKAGDRECPRGHGAMIEMRDAEQRHVVFESCTVCGGSYLDAGELRDLSEFTLLERLRSRFR